MPVPNTNQPTKENKEPVQNANDKEAEELEIQKKQEEFEKVKLAYIESLKQQGMELSGEKKEESPEKESGKEETAPSEIKNTEPEVKQADTDPQPSPEPEAPEAVKIYDEVHQQFEFDNSILSGDIKEQNAKGFSFFEENQRRMSEQLSDPEAQQKRVKSGWKKDALDYSPEQLQSEFDKADKAFESRSIIESDKGSKYKDVHQDAIEARKTLQELTKKPLEELQLIEVRKTLKNCFAKIALDDIIRKERGLRPNLENGKQVAGPIEATLNRKGAYQDFVSGLENSNTVSECVHNIGRPDAVIKPEKIANFLINKDEQKLSRDLYHESREVIKDKQKAKENLLEGLSTEANKHADAEERMEKDQQGLTTQEKNFNEELKFFRNQNVF